MKIAGVMEGKKGAVPGNKEMLLIQQLLIEDPEFPESFEAEIERDMNRGANGVTTVIMVYNNSKSAQHRRAIIKISPMRNMRYRLFNFDFDESSYFPERGQLGFGDLIKRSIDAIKEHAA